MLRLLEQIEALARRAGEAVAVRSVGWEREVEITRGELVGRVRRIAEVVRGRAAGRAVVLNYPNRPEFVAAFLGVLAGDGVLFPIAADVSGVELVGAVRRSGAGVVIAERGVVGVLGEMFERVEEFSELSESAVILSGVRECGGVPAVGGEPQEADCDCQRIGVARNSPSPRPARGQSPVPLASPGGRGGNAGGHGGPPLQGQVSGPGLLLQSSGTTGEPKIVWRDGGSLDAVTVNMVHACGFTELDRVLAVVPLCHSYGLEHGILAPMAAGSCVHVCEKFDLPAVLHEMRGGRVTVMPGVPFMFDTLCHTEGLKFPGLRRVYSAGGPLPFSTSEAFYKTFGLRIGQVYGSTEVGSVTFNDPDEPEFDPLCVGKPMEGVSIRILDRDDPRSAVSLPRGAEGLVAIKSPSMLSGYLDGESAHLIDGHFLTGDIGRVNESGSLTFSGRYKLLIDIGGRKVNPLEVEAVLAQHPGVGACVVVPLKLSETVQRLKAVVTRARPGGELSVQELRKFAQERLSRYKVPRVFEVRESLPTSAAGKVIRRLVESN